MEDLVSKFIEWWRTSRGELSGTIFHDDLFIKDCALGNAKGLWLQKNDDLGVSDFKIVKSFSTESEASLIVEQTDEITGLYYRHAIYLRVADGKIIDIVKTKEAVPNENKL